MLCKKCDNKMLLSGDYFFCGRHNPPFFIYNANQNTLIDPALGEFINELPPPILVLLREYYLEEQPFLALHRLCDLSEMITRFMAVAGLSAVYKQRKGFTESLQNTLSKELERPTFGSWKNIAELAFNELKNSGGMVSKELIPFWKNTWEPFIGNGQGEPSKIIPLRNKLAHGGRITDDKASELHEKFRKLFKGVLSEMKFLSRYRLVTSDNDTTTTSPSSKRVFLHHEEEYLSLFPLQAYDAITLWNEEDQTFQQYNDNAHLIYQRYNPGRNIIEFTSTHPRQSFSQTGDPFVTDFFDVFKVQEWRKKQNEKIRFKDLWPKWDYNFLDITTELTSLLVGRSTHISNIKKWANKNKETGGTLLITGKAGVGKSAVMAKYLQSAQGDHKNVVIPFFFRSGDTRCSEENFYYIAILKISEAFDLRIEEFKLHSIRNDFIKLLRRLEERILADSGKTLIFLLDGLDEILGMNSESLNLQELSKQSNVLWVISGRSETEVLQKYNYADTLWNEGELPSLSKNDIRELIQTECGNKKYNLYSLDRLDKDGQYHNEFVETLAQRSQGLPIYIHFVIEDLKENRLSFQDRNALPQNLELYYKTVVNRLKVSDVVDLTNRIFGLLSWANEPLSFEDFHEILRDEYDKEMLDNWKDILSDALLYGNFVLRKVKNRYGKNSWILYHDTFRYYLRNDKNSRIIRSRGLRLITEWCKKWEDADSKSAAYKYAIEHFSSHLLEQNNKEALFQLATNHSFITNQISDTEQFSASFRLFKHAMILASKDGDFDELTIFAKDALKLHDRLSDEHGDIITWAQIGSSESITKALKRIRYFDDHDRFLLYFFLIYYYLKGTKADPQDQEKNLSSIANEFNRNKGKTYWVIPAFQLLYQLDSYKKHAHILQEVIIKNTEIYNGADALYLLKQQLITSDQAFTLTFNMRNSDMKETALAELLSVVCEIDEIDKAVQRVETVADQSLQSELYSIIALRFVTQHEDWKAAIETLERIQDEYNENDGVKEVMDAVIELGAKIYSNESRAHGLVVWRAAAEYIYGYIDYESLEETIYSFAVLMKDICLNLSPSEDINPYLDIIFFLIRNDWIEEETHDQILYEIAKLYAKRDNVEKVLELILDYMKIYEYRNVYLISLAGEALKSEKLYSAISILDYTNYHEVQSGVDYLSIILFKKSDLTEIIKFAKQDTLTLSYEYELLERIVVQLAKYNAYDKARKLVEELDIKSSPKPHLLGLIENAKTEMMLEPALDLFEAPLAYAKEKDHNAFTVSEFEESVIDLDEDLKIESISEKIRKTYTIDGTFEKLKVINKLSVQLGSLNSDLDILSALRNQVGQLNKKTRTEDQLHEFGIPIAMRDLIYIKTEEFKFSFEHEKVIDLIENKKYEEAISFCGELEPNNRNETLIIIGEKFIEMKDVKNLIRTITLMHDDDYKHSFIWDAVKKSLKLKDIITAIELATLELDESHRSDSIEEIAEQVLEYYNDANELVKFLFEGRIAGFNIQVKQLLYQAVISAIPANKSSVQLISTMMPYIVQNRELLHQSLKKLEGMYK